jgi:hypothetical protein
MKHKHYDQIVAWAGGETIQFLEGGLLASWADVENNSPSWHKDTKYRVKPEIVRFRLGLMRVPQTTGFKFIVSVHYTEPPELHNNLTFVRWLGCWQEEEV